MHVQSPKSNHYSICYRSLKEFDETEFICDLHNIQLFEDTDDIPEAWSDLFLEVVSKHVPIK